MLRFDGVMSLGSSCACGALLKQYGRPTCGQRDSFLVGSAVAFASLRSSRSLASAFFSGVGSNGESALARTCTVVPGAIFTLPMRSSRSTSSPMRPDVRDDAVALLERAARLLLLLLATEAQEEEGHEDEERQQHGDHAGRSRGRRLTPAGGGLRRERRRRGRARWGCTFLEGEGHRRAPAGAARRWVPRVRAEEAGKAHSRGETGD